MSIKFKIIGLDCANCAAELERVIGKIVGIKEANINFMTEKLIIECEENEKVEVVEKMKKVVHKEEPDCTIKEI